MPSSAEHNAKYLQNRAFLDTGLAAVNPEWAAVVAFYAAVHLIERLAAAEPRGPVHHRTHSDREHYLRAHRQHRVVLRHYIELRDASEFSRYGTVNQFRTACPDTHVQDQLINVCLVAIEQYVASCFPPPVPHTPASPPFIADP